MKLNESIVENAILEWFSDLGYALATGPDIAPGEPASERSSFADVILVRRLQDAIRRLNPQIPPEAQDEALRKVVRLDTASFIGNNRAFHKMLRDGGEVEYTGRKRNRPEMQLRSQGCGRSDAAIDRVTVG